MVKQHIYVRYCRRSSYKVVTFCLNVRLFMSQCNKALHLGRQQWAYSVEKLRFLTKSENICPHSSYEDFLRGVQQKWATGPDVASWNLSRQSSQSFSKVVLLAAILKLPIWEFFNRIGRKQQFKVHFECPKRAYSVENLGNLGFRFFGQNHFNSDTAMKTIVRSGMTHHKRPQLVLAEPLAKIYGHRCIIQKFSNLPENRVFQHNWLYVAVRARRDGVNKIFIHKRDYAPFKRARCRHWLEVPCR